MAEDQQDYRVGGDESVERPMRRLETSDDQLILERLSDDVSAVDGPGQEDPRFLDWLALETRERDRARRLRSDVTFLERGEALVARVFARMLRVERRAEPLAVRAVSGDMSAGGVRCAPLVDLGVAAGVGRALWDEVVEQCVEIPTELPDAG